MRSGWLSALALCLLCATTLPVWPAADISDGVEAVDTAVVTVRTSKGVGSGFVITPEGHIVTCAHVVGKDDSVKVKLSDEQTGKAKVVARDVARDLAVLKTDLNPPAMAKLGASSGLKLGETVAAVGTPVGLEHSVTRGGVSARERRIGDQSYLQVDVPLNPGNSGGPLVDARGAVVGVATFIERDASNVGFAVPSETLAAFLGESDIKYQTVAGDSLKPRPQTPSEPGPGGKTMPQPGAPARPTPSLPQVLGLAALVSIICSVLTSLLVTRSIVARQSRQAVFAAPPGRWTPPPPPEDLSDVDITLH